MQNHFSKILALITVAIFLVSCNSNSTNDKKENPLHSEKIDTSSHAINNNKGDWLNSFDLDGDKINDDISFDFSGGAHCCYKLNITLSSDHIEIKFPFEMDGGYVGGVDDSQPDQFAIRDVDNDGLPEILMKIQTYNAKVSPIPENWQKKYGIKTNHIMIEYDKKQLVVRDHAF